MNHSRILSRIPQPYSPIHERPSLIVSPFHRSLAGQFFFEEPERPTGTPPAANPNPQPQGSQPDNNLETRRVTQAVRRAADDALNRHGGDADATVLTLVAQNHALSRAVNSEPADTAELAEWRNLGGNLKAVQAELAAYRAHGKPDDLKTRLSQAEADAKYRTDTERTRIVSEACALAGIDFADFSTRKGVDDWKLEVKAEKNAEGADIRVPYATLTRDGKEETKPLAEVAFASFPTLAKTGDGQQGVQQGVQRETQRETGPETASQSAAWVAQGVSGQPAPSGQAAIAKPPAYSM